MTLNNSLVSLQWLTLPNHLLSALWISYPGIIPGMPMGSANKRRDYFVMSSLIGWASAQNDPWYLTRTTKHILKFNTRSFNSLCPSDAIWHHITWSSLAQAVAKPLPEPVLSYHQPCPMASINLWAILLEMSKIIFEYYTFKKNTATSVTDQRVNHLP